MLMYGINAIERGANSLGIITDRGISVTFFTLVLFASTWYYIMKAKQQTNANESKNKFKDTTMMGKKK